MNDSDWFVRKQVCLLQDMIEAKAITIELLDNLTVLVKSLLSQAAENHIEIPNREAIANIVRRSTVLLESSHEATRLFLRGRPIDSYLQSDDKLPLSPIRRQLNRTLISRFGRKAIPKWGSSCGVITQESRMASDSSRSTSFR